MEIIKKYDLERIIRSDLIRILNTDIAYKYVDFDTGLYKIIKEKSLKFTNPTDFNDPFDCNENLLTHDNNEELINNIFNHSYQNTPRAARRKVIRQVKDQGSYSEILKRERENFRLSCFSEKDNEVLMWSHYANKHHGICIGFDFPHKYENKFILCHVKYLDKIIPIDGNADMLRVILYWLTTKSIRWEYENEIRAISTYNQEFIFFDKKFVKEISFGCKVTNQEIKDALNKIRKFGYDLNRIQFKKMEISRESFLLKERIIKPSL